MFNEADAIAKLKKLPLLDSISESRWRALAPHIQYRTLSQGEVLFNAGRESQNLYMVITGELMLHIPWPGLAKTQDSSFYLQSRYPGDTAGDFAVLNGGEHLVTAIAARETNIAMFPRFAFDQLVDIDSRLLAHVYDVASNLSRQVILAGAYKRLFGEVPAELMHDLLDHSVIHHFKSGDTVFKPGDAPNGLYVVIAGKLILEMTNRQGKRLTVEVQPPETVGELSLLANTARISMVSAARESTVALLNTDAFNRLIASNAQLLMRLSRLVVQRHIAYEVEPKRIARRRNVVVLPLDSRLPMRRFVHQLKSAMGALGQIFSLNSRNFDTLYGRAGASDTEFNNVFNPAIAEWLDDKEARFDALLYIADKRWNAWTRRCINRADRILLVAYAHHGCNTALRDIERELQQRLLDRRIRPIVELVLLHPAQTDCPTNTARWLAPRSIDSHHHIRINNPDHYARLSRRLFNQATGLVLSGGGARGYAHLGVKRLLEEQSIPIDFIGGASMGALLGASMAMGASYKDIIGLSAQFANKKALFDYTLPLASLMRSAKLTAFCQSVYRDQRIEDLWIPYFCVSSNLADGQEVIHDRGLLWKSVRTTISIPGVFLPVPTENGDLLVDGAVLNTFPVDIMKRHLGDKGFIIGVNVSEIPERFNEYEFTTSLSGWSVLLSRMNPFTSAIQIPRIGETLLRATDIKNIERLNESRRALDVLIEPDVQAIRLLDFASYQKISDIGYQEARRVLNAQD